ncbi:substrate-binding domain-containing protein [Actinosynnema sp. NPDC053489]|uniref:substrate-binding domain-containing protein n=1 Tax=Actinosynnema sp. NPDC053489 TaxID=3363916 RepID=UPI0037CAA153
MARPGDPVTTRRLALHARASCEHHLDHLTDSGVAATTARWTPARSAPTDTAHHHLGHRPVDRPHAPDHGSADAPRHRCADGPRGRQVGRTALDLPADRRVPAEADAGAAGGAVIRYLLDPEVPPRVVIAVGDPLAVGVHGAVLRPGTDVAVTGSGDSPPASVVDGGPTSVGQPVEGFARTAVDLLEGTSTTGDRGVVLPGGLISRGSAPIRLTRQDLNEWESR